jgi:GPN-loop GTPase
LIQNSEWLQDELEAVGEDEYIILDCPGQIELYSHLPIMHNLVRSMGMWGFRMVSVYLLDALFVLEPTKFISGCMLSLSCMLQLGLPHINVVSKCDIADKEAVQAILQSESASWLTTRIGEQTNGKLKSLTGAIASVLDDYMMIGFVMLDIKEEDSLAAVLAHTDHAVQYGEDAEPREPTDLELGDEPLPSSEY